jgi:hypothetical protein
MDDINEAGNDFISREQRSFKFKLGNLLASSLSGFIAGAVFASIIWLLAIYVFKLGL